MARNYILSGIILASFVQAVFLNKDDGCPAINVKKDQIIRTKEALENGAKYLEKKSVDSARECYKLCCGRDNCNLGMLSYKNDSNGHLVRNCYLFDCGSPSKCTFSPYKHYAIITFEDKKSGESTKNKGRKHDKFQPKQSKERWDDDDCPPGAPVALCSSNPCDTAACPSDPYAVCKPSTCGTCHGEFFNDDGERVKCYDYKKKSKPAHSSSSKWSEQYILKEIDRLHQNNLHRNNMHQNSMGNMHRNSMHGYPVDHNNQNTDLETRLDDYTNKKPVSSHKSQSNSMTDDWEINDKATDPPHEWREFIDNNPKYGKPHLVTEKPTRKSTTFHQWRDFIDNNPKYTRPPPRPKPKHTRPPPKQKTTMKPTLKTTKKMTKPHVKPKTKPVTDERPHTNSPPKVDDESIRTRNISDVVVIETSNLRIVENKAVVPLAIFLVIALLLLFVVALRLKVMKSRIRRKAFATDDADYLINGMYL